MNNFVSQFLEKGQEKIAKEDIERQPNHELESGFCEDLVKLYLQDIRKVPLLAYGEEVLLAKQVACGNEQARHKLILANLRLVVSIAKNHRSDNFSLLDLIQEGNIGLMRAIARFDYRKGYRFSTYASWWIRQAILQALSEKSRMIRVPAYTLQLMRRIERTEEERFQETGTAPSLEETSKLLGVPVAVIARVKRDISYTRSLEEPVDGEEVQGSVLSDFINKNAASPVKTVISELRREKLHRALQHLTARQRRILELRFGLYGMQPYTLEEVGKQFNLSGERIRQIEEAALGKLRYLLEK